MLKDAFDNSLFKAVEEFLNKVYSLYQTPPNRCCKLQRITEACGEAAPKPTGQQGLQWRCSGYQFCTTSYPASSMSEICNGEHL